MQRNDLADAAEFYCEEIKQLRSKYEPGSITQFTDWRQQRKSKLAQLEALNAELERMVANLEEDRRRAAYKLRSTDASRCAKRLHAGMQVPLDVIGYSTDLTLRETYCRALSSGEVRQQAGSTGFQVEDSGKQTSINDVVVHHTAQGVSLAMHFSLLIQIALALPCNDAVNSCSELVGLRLSSQPGHASERAFISV